MKGTEIKETEFDKPGFPGRADKYIFWLIFIIIVVLFATACKKETEKKGPENISENTASPIPIKKCKIISNFNYDAAGKQISHNVYYYTGYRLDSIVTFNPNKYFTTFYQYSSPTQRKMIQISYPSGSISAFYTLETLDDNGNMLESKTFGNDNKIISSGRNEYKCD